MTKEEQKEIMRAQLAVFPELMEKMAYMYEMFDQDANFSREARDEIRGEICRELKRI